ncbi:hypothetical protein ANANG_G00051060 [Anguilla anguilla]|uniref:SERTA domain-containing protein n=1 Tax=Anguilla anguilla TaxID=7936 RepID=A0A9D3MVD0_ANGAN|nr:hypothetical protein ANANG_G00051060 [Anguilla anguilla]
MLGKGAKRKLDEDEDGLEGKALAGLADGPSKASYTLQRQTIFNISLMKLYSQRAPPEPSLERRVLINNMLRRIQEELRQEGGPPRPLFFPASPPRRPHSFSSALEEIEELCTTVTATMTTTSPSGDPPPAPAPRGRTRKSAKKPAGPAPPSEGRVSMATAEPRPTDSAPPAPSLPPSSGLDASGTSSSSSSSSSAFLTDLALDDILFADIDTSMYDFDACTSTAGAGGAKTAPVVTADDLVKTLSPYGPGPPRPSPPASPSKWTWPNWTTSWRSWWARDF